ncbi:hypothetical protein PHYBOEH_008619 [Phytophthora boehmeriae]|uniref:Peptidase S1 domain-containing protein n=1 Tax=Phytophthora boehmeriae TaxID=109152 RepID=A0A8T1W3L0_9STRA|nr:hypothetical protein PHYBOEH_008619 [Phytophthora boehmeriae]
MKVVSTLAATSIALGCFASANAEHVERQLVLGGTIVPSGTKTYTTGLRPTAEGDSFCGGSLIASNLVLTSASCTKFGEINYVSVGTHYRNGTQDGEQIKVESVTNHTDYNHTSGMYDFAMVKLEKPSKFAPVKLPAADDSDIKPGAWSTVMGWGTTSYPNGTFSYELQGVNVELWGNDECAPVMAIVDTEVCAGGAPGKDSCMGDQGSPLILEKTAGDADDVLVGLSSWGSGCGEAGYPSVYSRVSTALPWINAAITPAKGQ